VEADRAAGGRVRQRDADGELERPPGTDVVRGGDGQAGPRAVAGERDVVGIRGRRIDLLAGQLVGHVQLALPREVLPGVEVLQFQEEGRGPRQVAGAHGFPDLLAEHRRDFTVLGGVAHPYVDGGHPADICFLTAAPHPSSGGFRNTISLDQFMAQKFGDQTPLPSLLNLAAYSLPVSR